MSDPFIHPSADVSEDAQIGAETCIWHNVHIREGARIGENFMIGKNCYVDFGVTIRKNVKIQNNALVYHGTVIEDGVFVGPGVILTNDKQPRAINPDGTLKSGDDWELGKILLKRGASLGAGAIILTGIQIGAFALVGAGAVVTRNVLDQGLVMGNPARLVDFVCYCGNRLQSANKYGKILCSECGQISHIPADKTE